LWGGKETKEGSVRRDRFGEFQEIFAKSSKCRRPRKLNERSNRSREGSNLKGMRIFNLLYCTYMIDFRRLFEFELNSQLGDTQFIEQLSKGRKTPNLIEELKELGYMNGQKINNKVKIEEEIKVIGRQVYEIEDEKNIVVEESDQTEEEKGNEKGEEDYSEGETQAYDQKGDEEVKLKVESIHKSHDGTRIPEVSNVEEAGGKRVSLPKKRNLDAIGRSSGLRRMSSGFGRSSLTSDNFVSLLISI
jgi:hypothetical protein